MASASAIEICHRLAYELGVDTRSQRRRGTAEGDRVDWSGLFSGPGISGNGYVWVDIGPRSASAAILVAVSLCFHGDRLHAAVMERLAPKRRSYRWMADFAQTIEDEIAFVRGHS